MTHSAQYLGIVVHASNPVAAAGCIVGNSKGIIGSFCSFFRSRNTDQYPFDACNHLGRSDCGVDSSTGRSNRFNNCSSGSYNPGKFLTGSGVIGNRAECVAGGTVATVDGFGEAPHICALSDADDTLLF